ncbi:MAG: hypothetical protein WKG32_08100 [Gemmatimonadaceae bacterium]
MTTRPGGDAATLAVIRIALLMGVIMFGAVTYFLHRGGGWTPAPRETLALLRTFLVVVWAGALAALLFLRSRLTGVTDAARRRTLLTIAWAVSESVALFGGVYYFLSDDPRWFLSGVFFMLAAFMIFPGRARR